nr:AraC family transcriptional regulator [Pseudonocardia spinosispora]
MDGVSRLVRMARLGSDVDVRCLLAGQFTLDNPRAGPGVVPFHLVLDGWCTVASGASTVALGPGQLLLLPQGAAHRVMASSGPRHRIIEEAGGSFPIRRSADAKPELDLFCGHYHFDSAAGELLFRLLPPMVHATLDTPALTLADVLRGEACMDGPGTGAIVAALCDALLVMALRSRPDQRLGATALWTAMADEVIGRVIADVIDRPDEQWTLDRMAATAAMSRATFIRRFTASTGTTAARLLTSIRMMRAADLLTHSDHSIARVADEVGYRSESAFAQAFRATLGTSPARFRRDAAAGRREDAAGEHRWSSADEHAAPR